MSTEFGKQHEQATSGGGAGMDRTLITIILITTIFTGFLLGYSIPPYVKAGVFSSRKEKGVENKIDKNMEQYYKDLYKRDE